MATLILRETHLALEEEIKSLEKLKRETSEKPLGESKDDQPIRHPQL